MTARYGTCSAGHRWHQSGNRTGHCSRCHRTFTGIAAFDAHFSPRSPVAPYTTCRDPDVLVRRDGTALFVAETADVRASSDGLVWSLALTERQAVWLARLRASEVEP